MNFLADNALCAGHQYQCHNGQCINATNSKNENDTVRCDRKPDCKDFSDEWSCFYGQKPLRKARGSLSQISCRRIFVAPPFSLWLIAKQLQTNTRAFRFHWHNVYTYIYCHWWSIAVDNQIQAATAAFLCIVHVCGDQSTNGLKNPVLTGPKCIVAAFSSWHSIVSSRLSISLWLSTIIRSTVRPHTSPRTNPVWGCPAFYFSFLDPHTDNCTNFGEKRSEPA